MRPLPPRFTRTATLFPDPTLFRAQRITIECSGVGGPDQFIVGSTFDIMVERSREPLSRLPLKIRNIIAAADASHARRSPLNSGRDARSEEHTSELQSLMRISYAVFCLKKNKTQQHCITTLTP